MTDEDICGAPCADDTPCKHPAGSCPVPSHSNEDAENHGRPSKFEDVRDDLVEAANGFLNHEQVANKGGVAKSTLYRYLDEHEDFRNAFKRARAEAADELVARALAPDDEIDVRFARFLLERSFKFIKTEKKEVMGEGGGPVQVNFHEEVVETPWSPEGGDE